MRGFYERIRRQRVMFIGKQAKKEARQGMLIKTKPVGGSSGVILYIVPTHIVAVEAVSAFGPPHKTQTQVHLTSGAIFKLEDSPAEIVGQLEGVLEEIHFGGDDDFVDDDEDDEDPDAV